MLEELRKHNALVQERIMKSFGYADTEDFIQKGEDEIELIQKGEIDYDWDLEKAVYADTAENRKLGRVGQEYHRGRKKTEKEIETRQDAIDFLTKNADKFNDYTFGYVDNKTKKKFVKTMRYVKMGKTFEYGKDGADEYKNKMEGEGYHVINVTPDSNQITYALIKKPK